MAKINEVVNRVRMEATTHGVDEQISKTKALVNAQGELVRSSDTLTKTTDESSKKRLSVTNRFEAHERRLIAVARAEFEYNKVQKDAKAFLEQNAGGLVRYNAVMAEQGQRLNTVREAAERNAIAQQKAAQSMVIPDRVVTMHEAVANAMKKTKEQLVPLFGIGQRYAEQVEHVRKSVAAGAISQDQGTAAIQRYRAATHEQVEAFKKVDVATGKYINGTGLARHELINLSRQAQDVGVSLMSGQGLFTVLTQQGSQIADIFISTGATMKSFWGQVAAGAAFIARPLIVAGSTVAAFGVAAVTAGLQWASAQVDVSRAVLGIGRASGVTLGDINKIAKQTSSAFGLSTSEAREFATELARTGRIGAEEITELAKMGKDVARVLGVDAVDAAKMLAQAMTSPKGAAEMNQRLGFMDAAMQRQVESLFAQNKLMEVQQLLSKGIKTSVEDVNKTVGVGSQIWTGLGNTVSNTWDKIGESINRAVGNVDITEQLISLQNDLQPLMERFFTMAPRVQIGQEGQRLSLQIEATQNKIRELNAELEKTAKASAEAKLNLQSAFAADLVRTVLPDLKGMEGAQSAAKALQEILKQINKEMMQGGESPLLQKMGMDLKTIELAARVAAEAVKELQDKMAQQERRLGRREEVREQFEGTGISADIGMQLNQMKDQLAVAQAITAQERMRAQEIATTRQLLDDGRSIEEATAVAAAQRANTQAQINSGAQLTLAGLQDQFGVASAVTGQEKMRAQEIATTNNLIRQGVDAGLAARIAAQEHANAQAQINSQAQLTLAGLQDQFAVASAITGKQKMRAQEEATYNNLVRQGVDVVLAANIAEQERANTQAQINANAQNTLLTLRDQAGVVGAITGAERIAAQEQATYNKLVREGVDATIAEAVAAQEAENARAAATAAVYRQVIAVQQETALIRAQGTAWEGATKAAIAYDNAIMSGASERSAAHLREAVLIREKARTLQEQNRQLEDMVSGMRPGTSIFEPARAQMWREDIMPEWYKSERMKNVPWGLSMEQPRNQMTPKGFEELIVPLMLQQGGVAGALKQLTSKPIFGQFDFYTENPFPDVVNRLIELLPEKDQAATLQQVLEQVKTQPISLAREELIKDLTDKIEDLKNSTDALNDTIEIDPLYTQGHGYIGIGYYTEGGRSSRIPLDPNTPPHVPDLPTTTPVLPPPTTQSDPIQYPIQLPVSSQLTPYTEEQLRYRREHPGTPINFANGGSFMVGGTGGTDSQYIPMRLTPGEMIDVTPPHGKANGKPTVVNNITNNFNFPPDRSYGNRRTQRQAREGYGRSVATMH